MNKSKTRHEPMVEWNQLNWRKLEKSVYKLLAEELGVSDQTIRRLSKVLEEEGAIIRLKLGAGSIYAYCLDPEEVWKSWNTTKKYAAFNTKTLARKQDNGDVKRRIMVMLKGQEFSEVEGEG